MLEEEEKQIQVFSENYKKKIFRRDKKLQPKRNKKHTDC